MVNLKHFGNLLSLNLHQTLERDFRFMQNDTIIKFQEDRHKFWGIFFFLQTTVEKIFGKKVKIQEKLNKTKNFDF